MLPRTVLLIPGSEIGWSDLRTMLRQMPEVQIVSAADDGADAVALADDMNPDVILAATSIAGASALPLLTALRQHAPASRLLLFAPRFTREELAAYAALGTAGFLVWGDLTCQALHNCLAAVLAADVHISSQAAVDAFMETIRDPMRLRPAHI